MNQEISKETDLQWTIRQLEEKGEVSRNDALKVYNTRLGSRIWDLRQEGWKIADGEYRKTQYGKDFVYTLIAKPNEQMKML